MFDKEKYREAFETLSEFLDIVNEGCGQSYWIPPGQDKYFYCDMGYVFDFWDALEKYFEGGLDPDAGHSVKNLIDKGRAADYIKKYCDNS